jgi:hypothetical protein
LSMIAVASINSSEFTEPLSAVMLAFSGNALPQFLEQL